MNIILTTPEAKIEDVEITVKKTLEYLKDPFYMAGICIGIQPLKGTIFYEEYTNFKSHISNIEGTQFKLRRDDWIWATDPMVKELQKRYLSKQADFIKEYIKENNIKHPNQAVMAPAHLILVQNIINEIKLENKLENKEDKINDNIGLSGAGRNYSDSPLYSAILESENIAKNSPKLNVTKEK